MTEYEKTVKVLCWHCKEPTEHKFKINIKEKTIRFVCCRCKTINERALPNPPRIDVLVTRGYELVK